MSKLSFHKYQGAGNDFILIDDRALFFDPKIVFSLCHRKFGIGADGVILLQNSDSADFRMRIFNADGSEAESCGNGLRCLTRFIYDLGCSKKMISIQTKKRVVLAEIIGEEVCVDMGEAKDVKQLYIKNLNPFFLDTGVPHLVIFEKVDFIKIAPKLRNHDLFQPQGVNVNVAVLREDQKIEVRTFERGVENETLSCGTGAVAVAIAASLRFQLRSPIVTIFPGGRIKILVDGYKASMIGEAQKVFEGRFCLPRSICSLDNRGFF